LLRSQSTQSQKCASIPSSVAALSAWAPREHVARPGR
jgi:hypothetical protein